MCTPPLIVLRNVPNQQVCKFVTVSPPLMLPSSKTSNVGNPSPGIENSQSWTPPPSITTPPETLVPCTSTAIAFVARNPPRTIVPVGASQSVSPAPPRPRIASSPTVTPPVIVRCKSQLVASTPAPGATV